MTLTHCGALVRRQDPDRFLLSMFAKPEARPALWALYAFNHEIARTREVVTETQLGLIRLQWWRDALEKGGGAGNPVLGELNAALSQHGIPPAVPVSLIYAREFDLEDRQPASLQGLVNYADFTSTPLLLMSLQMAHANAAGIGGITTADELGRARDIATAYALTGLLRAVPAHLQQRRCLLPADMTPPVEELYEGKGLEKLKAATEVIAGEAGKRLVSSKITYLDTHARLAEMHLDQIRKAGYDLFHPRLKIPPLARGVRLWWASL